MNEKFINKIEQLSPKEKLHQLEKEGKFVFHGSPQKLSELTPKQAKQYLRESCQNIDDGNPGVCSTISADQAIFRAITHPDNFQDGLNYFTTFGSNQDGELTFRASQDVLKNLADKTGYVYVFNKDDFNLHKGFEYRSQKKIKPVEIIKVNHKDLPDNIKLDQGGMDEKDNNDN